MLKFKIEPRFSTISGETYSGVPVDKTIAFRMNLIMLLQALSTYHKMSTFYLLVEETVKQTNKMAVSQCLQKTFFRHLAKTKVSELQIAITIKQAIFRFKITVDDVVGVQILQRLNNTAHVETACLLAEWTSVQKMKNQRKTKMRLQQTETIGTCHEQINQTLSLPKYLCRRTDHSSPPRAVSIKK